MIAAAFDMSRGASAPAAPVPPRPRFVVLHNGMPIPGVEHTTRSAALGAAWDLSRLCGTAIECFRVEQRTPPAVNIADAVELCACGEPATHFDDERGAHRCADCGPTRVPCSGCGRPTTWDDTYEDLCGACAFADNH